MAIKSDGDIEPLVGGGSVVKCRQFSGNVLITAG